MVFPPSMSPCPILPAGRAEHLATRTPLHSDFPHEAPEWPESAGKPKSAVLNGLVGQQWSCAQVLQATRGGATLSCVWGTPKHPSTASANTEDGRYNCTVLN